MSKLKGYSGAFSFDSEAARNSKRLEEILRLVVALSAVEDGAVHNVL
jgi:hypothetical protein